jgi:hypothetical protein
LPNPITDELSDDAKAELAEQFRNLALRFPPRRHRVPADAVTMRELRAARSGW